MCLLNNVLYNIIIIVIGTFVCHDCANLLELWQVVLPSFDDCGKCCTKIYNPLRCYCGRCFCHCHCNLLMADGIATVADQIATLVMTDVIVNVEMTILCNS